MARLLASSLLLLVSIVSVDASARGLFSAPRREGEPALARRIQMIRDLQVLGSGRALSPHTIRRLARHGPAFPTRERLVDRLASERNDTRRAAYAHELLRIGDRAYERAFVGAFARAGNGSAGVVARALAYYGSERSVGALVQGLGRAATAGPAEDALVSLGGRAVPALLEEAEQGARAPGVLRALGRIGDPRARGLLAARLDAADPMLARAASAGLVFLGGQSERARAEALVPMLEGEDRVRFFLVWLDRDPGAAVAHLTPADAEDPRVAVALSVSESPALDGARLALLGVETPARALAMARLGDSTSGRRLLRGREGDEAPLPALAVAAVRANDAGEREAFLAKVGVRPDAPLLGALLDSSVSTPTPALFRALAQEETFPVAAYLLARPMREAGPTARARYRRALREGLRSPHARIRLGACTALGALGDEGDAPALARALEDEEGAVRVAAAEALARLADSDGKEAIERAIRTELDAVTREALSAVAEGRPWASPLGRTIFGEKGAAFPNSVILFASGSTIAY